MKIKLLFLVALLAGFAAKAQEWRPGPHPRLLMRKGEEPHVFPESRFAKADSVIVAFSDAILSEPAVTRTFIGRRLLGTSREALKRIFWLGYTYRVHGGKAYARKAIDEMLAVSAFSDWNPAHFLDVGEMTMAVAIGYDWFYDRMTPRERKTVARAIIDKGLKPALNESDAWFYTSEINWNSVCNAGMVYGALAVWEEDPVFCRSMLEKSIESNKLAYKAYEGGGYPEGYNYWGYGTSFQIMLEEALRPFLGVADEDSIDSGITPNKPPDDFYASSDFTRFTSTPAGNCYSFSDSYRKASGQYMQAWMATRVGDPTLLDPEIRIMEDTGYKRLCEERLFPMFPISLMWYSSGGIPFDHYFQCGGTTPIFVYRSGWKSQVDDYLGVKGGLTMSSHSHCDQGSFYFESDGVAWATDLGMQDYNSLESAGVDLWDMTQDSERWEVFRIGPFSHNILTVNGHTPKVNHPVTIQKTWTPSRPSWDWEDRIGAVLDLTDIYAEDLDSCKRAVYLRGEDLNILDLVQAGDSVCTIRWAMCTEAEASLQDWSEVLFYQPDERFLTLKSGRYKREMTAEFVETRFRFPAFPLDSIDPDIPDITPHIWPTTYDPATPDVDGMQYLHPTDAPNPGTSLVGYTFTLQPHQKVVLHVTLSRVL